MELSNGYKCSSNILLNVLDDRATSGPSVTLHLFCTFPWTAKLKMHFLFFEKKKEKGINLLSEPKGHRKPQREFVGESSFKFNEREIIEFWIRRMREFHGK